MDLSSSAAFWPVRDGLPRSYPRLDGDCRCEVAVLGAGVTGALVADSLAQAGRDVVVLDKRDVGHGSTSASTALLQYEIDVSLVELSKMRGADEAARAYRAAARSVEIIASRVASLGQDCGFEARQSVYFASRARDAKQLRAEHQARERAGLKTEVWSRPEVEARFSFTSSAAILSSGAAQLDPYRFTHALLERAAARGTRIFDRVGEVDVIRDPDGVALRAGPHRVRADRVVVAAGYEAVRFLPKRVVSLHSSFALVSEPIEDFSGWWDRCLLWETARPYVYLRTTGDNRAIIGGEDDPFRNATRRDSLIPRKTERLAARFRQLFPRINLEVAYSWAGTFGETKDGLAYIGPDPAEPRVLFACGFGGNGIVFSALAAEILREEIAGRVHPDADLFRLDR